MTVREASQRIGISASLVYALCHEGVLPYTRHGRPGKRGTIRITDEAVAEYITACKGEGRQNAAPLVLKHIRLS